MHNGVRYDLGGYSEEKLKMVWEANPHLRFAFEEEEHSSEDIFQEGLIELGIDTPEKFEEEIKKVAKKPIRKKK